MRSELHRIVRCEERHFDELAGLYRRVRATAEADGETFSVDEYRETVTRLPDLWLLHAGGKIVGFVGGRPLNRYGNAIVANLFRDPAAGY